MMHLACESFQTLGGKMWVITTPYIINFEGVYPGPEMVYVAEEGGFPIRKAGFSLALAHHCNRAGPGTLDELTQIIEAMVYGEMHPRTVLSLVNRHGFYNSTMRHLSESEALGYLPEGFCNRIIQGGNGENAAVAVHERLMRTPRKILRDMCRYYPDYVGASAGHIVHLENGNRENRSWVNNLKQSLETPTVALVTGRPIDKKDPAKRKRRHELIEKMNIRGLLEQLKANAPGVRVLYVNENTKLTRDIVYHCRALGIRTLGLQGEGNGNRARLIHDSGSTKMVANAHVLDHALLEMADIVVPLDHSMRALSVWWQAMVYANIKDPTFNKKEVWLYDPRASGVHRHTRKQSETMIRMGTMNQKTWDVVATLGTPEEAGAEIARFCIGEGRRYNVAHFPPPPQEKIRHLAIPDASKIRTITPETLGELSRFLRRPVVQALGRGR
ncbi:MAG: hypothetical protein EYC62_08145 [Alphaproteobacteria bacterium]|nr:MAG: hypothetical protein EYC62_08145 [Alphaproteobacteria bacterium]